MIISKYIGDLLYKHECIVIPDLGGFITNYSSAEIDAEKHIFSPPSKKIVFNAYLKMNDGLLINHIALSENISYIEAKAKVAKFVKRCHTELANGRRIRFQKIGLLYNNEEGNIQFEPEYSINYLENSFGLSKFISPPIKRKNINEKIIEKINKQKEEEKKTRKIPSFYKWAAAIAIPLITLFTLYIINGDSLINFSKNQTGFFSDINIFSNQKTTKPLSNKQLISEIEKIKNEAKLLAKDSSFNNVVLEKAVKPVVNKKPILKQENNIIKANKPIIKSDIIKPITSDKKYKIICGSFGNKTFALRYIKQLKKEGFDAKIIEHNKTGFYRVSIFELSDKNEAAKQLTMVRTKYNKSAWILTN
ncbi:MAG: SPOR domain-containing protein [Bacteroidales bacterium]|nr:SPOR domain-containing protein [Bacteroidales bacterium]